MDGYQPKQSRVMKQIKKSNLAGLAGLILSTPSLEHRTGIDHRANYPNRGHREADTKAFW